MSYIDELHTKWPLWSDGDWCHEACAEVDRLRADVALATETITKCHKWIEDAKPLLERGGEAERQLAAARANGGTP
jgi:hypothetical protein